MIQSESDFYRIIIVSRAEERRGREIASVLHNQTVASPSIAINLSGKCFGLLSTGHVHERMTVLNLIA
jgi:hypothetical protein